MMKKVKSILIVILGVSLFACADPASTKEGNIIISGSLDNLAGKRLTLEQFVNNQPVIVDSSIVADNGHYELAVTAEKMDFYRITSSPQNAAILILSPDENVKINGDGSKLANSVSVEGSKNTDLLWSYYKEASDFGKNSQELRTQAQAFSPEENEKKQELIDQFNALNLHFLSYTKEFIDQNSESPAVLSALGNLNIENDLDYFIKARDGLKGSFGESNFYSSLDQQIKQYEEAKEKEKMFDPGNKVPNITQNDPSGNARSLYDLKGKVVLVDFWASWCRPCRAENPNVVRLYNKYKNDGFDIFSVSLDKTQDKWVNAIEADGLAWENHVSDLQYWSSEAAQLYNVKSIPFTVLLDREGAVIDIKLRGATLEKKLEEIFGY